MLLTSGKLYYELDAYRHDARHHRHRDRPARADLPGAAPQARRTSWRPTPTSPTSAGCRRNRPTRAPGPFLALALPEMMPRLTGIKRVSRRAMAAPSAGSARVHEVEQAAVIAAAFAAVTP